MATWEYNLAGQLIKRVDHQGLITTYAYTQGSNTGSICKGSTIIIVNPNGTTIKETLCDKQLLSITGSAQISKYFDYGINTDGSSWSKIFFGGANSARWEINALGLMDQMLYTEKSSYGGEIKEQKYYNAKGQCHTCPNNFLKRRKK